MLSHRTRSAFSLVEMMIALALTMFIVLILTQAFVTSLDAFSALKSLGTMQNNLRIVANRLQADLQFDHFEGKRRLSDPDLLTTRPRQGYFYIYQGAAVNPLNANPNLDATQSDYVIEGWDNSWGTAPALPPPAPVPDMYSYRAGNQWLAMTVKLRGNRPEDVFSALVPTSSQLWQSNSNYFNQSTTGLFQNSSTQNIGGQSYSNFNSQWAEVYYFLVRTGTTDNPTDITSQGTATNLYALYRAQYLLVPNPIAANNLPVPNPNAGNPPPNSSYANVSWTSNGGNLVFNAPEDVASIGTNRVLRMQPGLNLAYPVKSLTSEQWPPLAPAPQVPSGATLLQSNVVSFQVQVFTQKPESLPGPEFQDVNDNNPPVPAAYGVYDTATATSYNIVAVKITIRIFDPATKMARQVSVIQDM